MSQEFSTNGGEENQSPGGERDIENSNLAHYNKLFLNLVEQFESLRNPKELKSANSGEGSNVLLSSIADKMVQQLKSGLKPEELLEIIRLLDKIYLQCTAKGKINETLFQFLQEKGSLFSSKENTVLDKDTKEELQGWFAKHQKDLFEN